MKINWTEINQEHLLGEFEEYEVEISRKNHGGWAYELIFERKNIRLILAKHGHSSPFIKSLHAAKYHSLKKLDFFYAQQHNQTESLQK